MVPGVVNFCWKVSPCCIPPDAPDLNFGPGPLSLVTSWPTLSSLVHFTVPPLATVTLGGLKALPSFFTTAASPPHARHAWGEHDPPPPLSLPPPQPAATSPRASTEHSTASVLFMRRS